DRPLWGMSFSRHAYQLSALISQCFTGNWPLATVLRLLRAFRTVLRAPLVAARDAGSVERSAHHVITHARQILHAAPTNEHNRVLLQVMANAWDIRRHFDSIGQANARHFAQRRVRLLRRLGIHARAHSALLRTRLQRRTRRLIPGPLAAEFHQLIKCRHSRHSQTRQTTSLPHISHNPSVSRAAHIPAETGLAPSQVWHRPVAPSHTLPRRINAGENSFNFPLRLNRRRR